MERGTDVRVGGLPLARFDRAQVVDYVFAALAEGRGGWLITANVDHSRRFAKDPEIRRLYAGADLIVADGMPLVWASRLQRTPLPERVAGSDLVWLLAGAAAGAGRSVYLLGGDPGATEGAERALLARWPDLRIAGTAQPWVSPEPTPEELASLGEAVRASGADLVYVGLGSPKQERVIEWLRGELPRAWLLGVGISLSFLSGQVQRAPSWAQRLGLEWLHRLAQEPRRLARRYFVENLPYTLGLLARAWRARAARSSDSSRDPA